MHGTGARCETRVALAYTCLSDPDIADLASDLYMKTKGNAQELEFCLNEYRLATGPDQRIRAVQGHIATIGRLPHIHRHFLMIASWLEGGMKLDYAISVVRRLAATTSEDELRSVIKELVAHLYLKINSTDGNRIKPSHEKVVRAMQETASDESDLELRYAVLDELRSRIEVGLTSQEEGYLLHCLVSLQSTSELKQNLQYIIRLIGHQYRADNYAYLVALSETVRDIVPLLNAASVERLLDAFQKTSSFDKGLAALATLHLNSDLDARTVELYRAKFLTQTYEYERAIDLLREMEQTDWVLLYRTNALQALSRNDEAREIVDAVKVRHSLSEPIAVILRNSVNLYDYTEAIRHLDKAKEFFQRQDSAFRTATVLNNRGLAHITAGLVGSAMRDLEHAIRRFEEIGSNEAFQPLMNLGILHAMQGRPASAERCFDRCVELVPTMLLLDRCKLRMNRSILRFRNGGSDAQSVATTITKSQGEARGLTLPYLRESFEHNLAVLRWLSGEDNERPQRSWLVDESCVSIHVEIDCSEGDRRAPLLMSLSPHWRY